MDYLYVLCKGGQNVFWGPTQTLSDFMSEFDIHCNNKNHVPIEMLVRLSAVGLHDQRLIQMKNTIEERINHLIESNEINLISQSKSNKTKKFYIKDIWILLRREVTELFEYRYVWFILNVIIVIIVSAIVSTFYDSDIGIYDDCTEISPNKTCQQQLKRFTMVDMNLAFLRSLLFFLSFTQSMTIASNKLIKLNIFLHQRQHSKYFFT